MIGEVFDNKRRHHHFRSLAVFSLGACMLGFLFYFLTSEALDVKVTSGVWFFYLSATVLLAGIFAYYTFGASRLQGRKKLAVFSFGACLFGAVIALLIVYKPFAPTNMKAKLGLRPVFDFFDALLPTPENRKALGYTEEEAVLEKSWRKFVPPVIDQGECGCCWAAASALVMSAYVNSKLPAEAKIDWKVSPQWLVDADTNTGKCNGNTAARGFQLAVAGALSLECTPFYMNKFSDCSSSAHPSPAGHLLDQSKCTFKDAVPLSSCLAPGKLPSPVKTKTGVVVAKGEKEMKDEISFHGPIICPLNFYTKKNGDGPAWALSGVAVSNGHVSSPTEDGDEYSKEYVEGGHAVAVTGYGTTVSGVPFWEVANSWGSAWGDSGYSKIIRGVDAWNLESVCVGARIQ